MAAADAVACSATAGITNVSVPAVAGVIGFEVVANGIGAGCTGITTGITGATSPDGNACTEGSRCGAESS